MFMRVKLPITRGARLRQPIRRAAHARRLRAVRAAEHPLAGLDAVADDLAPAVLARRGHRVDRALERVERVRLAPALDRHGLVVLVATELACRHGARATRAAGRSLDAG